MRMSGRLARLTSQRQALHVVFSQGFAQPVETLERQGEVGLRCRVNP